MMFIQRLSKGQRAHHNISPDRFKVSRSAESVTSRLFPQYKVKFEYKASQRENASRVLKLALLKVDLFLKSFMFWSFPIKWVELVTRHMLVLLIRIQYLYYSH